MLTWKHSCMLILWGEISNIVLAMRDHLLTFNYVDTVE